MTAARVIFAVRVLAAHWRRRPFQLLVLALGLSVATALWSGVQAINAEARDSYDRTAAILGGDRLASLVPAERTHVSLADYIALRRAGWDVSPVIEAVLRHNGRSHRVLGVDPITLPQMAASFGIASNPGEDMSAFVQAPWQLRGDPATIAALQGLEGPALAEDRRVAPGVLVADIAFAAALTGRPGDLDRLIVAPEQRAGLPPVAEITEGRLRLVPPRAEASVARMADSFHLNLTAFGFLSFVVGLFIVHGAAGAGRLNSAARRSAPCAPAASRWQRSRQR